jgi:hypothetical protein
MLDNVTRIVDTAEFRPVSEVGDPLVELGKRWEREMAVPTEDPGRDAACERAYDIEDQIAAMAPSSLAGALVYLRLLDQMVIDDHDRQSALINRVTAFVAGMVAAGG